MQTKEMIQANWDTSEHICNSYLSDLDDADLMTRPHAGCNHLNWQVGHLILSEHNILSPYAADRVPPLPEGFAEFYGKENAHSNDPSAFLTKDALMQAFRFQRDEAKSLLETCADTDFDAEAPEAIRSFAPTVGAMMSMLGSHWLMHCGQWVIVRRMLDKPVII